MMKVTLLMQRADRFVKGLALLYLRFACVPTKMWDWFYAYIDEPLQITITRVGKKMYVSAQRPRPQPV
jgi:hypothetical protein